MFKKLFDEMMRASTEKEINDILYRKDGVDMAYQREKLSWEDHERLFNLADRLASSLR